jgi:hypothetical protein
MKGTIRQCVEAIIAADGDIAVAAKNLGVSKQAVYSRIKKHEQLQMVVHEIREQGVDVAESELMKKVRAGDITAIIFKLKCHGKDRGYVDRPDNVAIAISTLMDPAVAAAMIER